MGNQRRSKMPVHVLFGRKFEPPVRNKSFNDGFLEDDSGYKGSEEKWEKVQKEDFILKPTVKSLNDGFLQDHSKSFNDAFIQDDSGYRSPELSPEESSSLFKTPMRTLRNIRFSLQATPASSPVLRSRAKEEAPDVLVSLVPSIVTMILVSAILYMTFISGDTQRFGNMKYESIK